PIVSIVSHGCIDRIVARSDCMLVCGTTSNVHVMAPLEGGAVFGSPGWYCMVTVPCEVPVRNEAWPDGAVGVASRPQLASAESTRIAIVCFAGLVIRSLPP